MSFEFRAASPTNRHLVLGFAGPSGSGKTYTALLCAKAIAAGERFAVIDTEAGRAAHYADEFDFDHGDLQAPFTPDAYLQALQAADDAGYPVIVIDSLSHEHDGEGGLLDWHTAEQERMAKGDPKLYEAVNLAAWNKPKAGARRFRNALTQRRAHLILCFRAEEKVDVVKDPQTGKTKIVPKRSFTGRDGWVPIAEKKLPYEMTIYVMFLPDRPGVPLPVKTLGKFASMISLDEPISEATGKRLAEWAAGAKTGPGEGGRGAEAARGGNAGTEAGVAGASESQNNARWAQESDVTAALEIAAAVGADVHDKVVAGLAAHREKNEGRVDAKWLARQVDKLLAKAGAAA